jgi:hypothetical protein
MDIYGIMLAGIVISAENMSFPLMNEMQEIPPNATIRREYIRCGRPDCQKLHGPYLYAYWKQGKKLMKRYVGKKFEDLFDREIAKGVKLRPSLYIKYKFILQEASRGNELAKQYLEKLTNGKVSIDWAHRVLINRIRGEKARYERMKFIFSEMKKEGLDPNNEEDLDRYLRKAGYYH